MCDIFSDETMGLSFTLLVAFDSAVTFGHESRWFHDLILLYKISDYPNLEDKFLLFISPREGVVELYHQTRVFLCLVLHITSWFGPNKITHYLFNCMRALSKADR
jgi:hypothetical protein